MRGTYIQYYIYIYIYILILFIVYQKQTMLLVQYISGTQSTVHIISITLHKHKQGL
jgi:hypothetical protein